MAHFRFFRTCLIGLSLFFALPAAAQPADTLPLRATADSLNHAAIGFFQSGDLQSAAETFLEAIRIWETIQGERTAGCASSFNGLASCYMYLGDLEQALSYYDKALGIRREVLGEEHADYASTLSNIGACLCQLGDYDESITYFSKALEIRKEVLGEHHVDYAASLNNLGVSYWNLRLYDEALMYLTEALEIRKEVLGERHPDYAMTLNNLGLCYWDKGDYGKGIDYLTRTLKIRLEVLGEKHPDYAASLHNLGRSFFDLGDYDRAITYYSEASDIYHECYGDQHPLSAMGFMDIGNCYVQLERYAEAVTYYEKALDIYKALFGGKHLDYASTLQNLGICYTDMGKYDKALASLAKALEIRKEILGEQHPDYALCLLNMGCYYHNVEEYEKAIACASEALCVFRDVLGERSPDYAQCLVILGHIYSELGDRDSTSAYLRNFYSLASGIVLDSFMYLPQNQRGMYWDTYSVYFTNNLPVFAHLLSGDKQFLCTAYDGALFSKGLLLNAETEMRRLVLESGDEDALSLYDRLLEERQQLDVLYEIPVSERPMPTDSLEHLCEMLERELQQKSRVFGDYTKNLSVTWKDVQAVLGKRDIAIEFMEVHASTDTTLYCALTLKPGYDAPHLVELFDVKELDALKAKYAGRAHSEGLIYEDKMLYDLVWKPLEAELKGVKNIYFGPSGELYQTAVEYADNGKGPLASQKNVFRLSSTRQLVTARDEMPRRRSVVFGGLKYGASEEVLLADSRKYAQRSMPEDPFFRVDSLDIRGAGGGMMVADLPGTETEALEIDVLLRNAGLDNTLRMGEEGTEAAFKDLSGRRENIIHVATHGFYWNARQSNHIGKRLGRNLDGGTGRILEDASMTRSGLLFSGANNALRGGSVKKEGVDDGILTAKEIARLDLRGADLLVLSACQTGLGEVSGEGVFGLQRGFKKAGVNTILMSLWEVDDEATCLLMTSFYKELAKGRTNSEALKAAQKAVRDDKDKDFSSPYYWASFILLDGIERKTPVTDSINP